jgi:hypothetical protein
VALQVTVVVPTGKLAPEGGVQITLCRPQLSEAVGIGKVTTPPAPGGHVGATTDVTLAGHVITGGVLSVTVTVN